MTTGGVIRIANSKGINFIGGQMGSNVIIRATDPSTGSSAVAGPNKIQGAWIRNDIPGFVNPHNGADGAIYNAGLN